MNFSTTILSGKSTRKICLFFFFLIVLTDPMFAQEASDSSVVVGFQGFLWGTPIEEVIAKRGEPLRRTKDLDWELLMWMVDEPYPNTSIGMAFVNGRLRKGMMLVPVQFRISCTSEYEVIRDIIKDKYSNLHHQSAQYNKLEDIGISFCSALALNSAARADVWTGADGSAIGLILDKPDYIEVHYETPGWEQTVNDARARFF